jgi:hypothetical protein
MVRTTAVAGHVEIVECNQRPAQNAVERSHVLRRAARFGFGDRFLAVFVVAVPRPQP